MPDTPTSFLNRPFGPDVAPKITEGWYYSDVEFELQNNVAESGLKAADCLSLVEGGDRTFCYFASSYSAHRFADIAILDLPFVVSDRYRAYQALDGDFGDAMKDIVRSNSDYELVASTVGSHLPMFPHGSPFLESEFNRN